MNVQTLKWIQAPAVAFAQVREDSEIDLLLLRRTDKRRALVIASGGCTAALLAPQLTEGLWLADRNPAQLALAREKLHLVSQSKEVRHAWLGQEIHQLGKYERLFEYLRLRTGDLRGLLTDSEPLSHVKWPILQQACREVFADDHLREIFGVDATQGTYQSFADHFVGRLKGVLTSPLRNQNPWLAQMLLGEFKDAVYPWLAQPPANSTARIFEFCEDLSTRWPKAASGLDFIGLSNITDWMSAPQTVRCLRQAWKNLARGGVLILRQLNSIHDFEQLVPMIPWDRELASRLHSKDRSFFYRRLFVARKEA